MTTPNADYVQTHDDIGNARCSCGASFHGSSVYAAKRWIVQHTTHLDSSGWGGVVTAKPFTWYVLDVPTGLVVNHLTGNSERTAKRAVTRMHEAHRLRLVSPAEVTREQVESYEQAIRELAGDDDA